MRLMGIDYGTKRVGIALSDDKGLMAFPYSVIGSDKTLIKEIETIVQKEKVGKIVIGHSLNKSGEANTVQGAIEALMLDITLNLGLPVELEPERYTTQEAKRLQGKNSMTDASAATIILNSYIARNQHLKAKNA